LNSGSSLDPSAAWRLERRGGVHLIRCAPLEYVPGVVHAFSTRHGDGGAAFDLGSHDDPRAEVGARRVAFLEACGLGGRRPTRLHQVHGTEVIDARDPGLGAPDPRADGALATAREAGGWAPAVRWADCVPVLLASDDGGAVAAVHSGWRGTAAGIAPRAVARFAARGWAPRSLVAAVGPAIGACCYEVGAEVAAAVARSAGSGPERGAAEPGERLRLDPRRPLVHGLHLGSVLLLPAGRGRGGEADGLHRLGGIGAALTAGPR